MEGGKEGGAVLASGQQYGEWTFSRDENDGDPADELVRLTAGKQLRFPASLLGGEASSCQFFFLVPSPSCSRLETGM